MVYEDKMIKINTMPPEERFSRTLIGVLLIAVTFFEWGKWVAMVLGMMFILSAWLGYCFTCELYKRFHKSS